MIGGPELNAGDWVKVAIPIAEVVGPVRNGLAEIAVNGVNHGRVPVEWCERPPDPIKVGSSIDNSQWHELPVGTVVSWTASVGEVLVRGTGRWLDLDGDVRSPSREARILYLPEVSQ